MMSLQLLLFLALFAVPEAELATLLVSKLTRLLIMIVKHS